MLRDYYESEGMSMRGYHKLVRTSRTIADLEGSGMITEDHVAEALYYRGISHSYWNGEQVQLFGGGMYDDR